MKIRTLHLLFLAVALPLMAVGGWAVLRSVGKTQPIHDNALTWAVATAGLHGLLGWRLWKQHLKVDQSGIASGVKILGVRFFTGVGLFVTGIVMNPEAKEVFATLWTGIFLILLVSETIFFFKGVHEL